VTAALAAVLGAAAGVDRTAFGQTLLSHPAVVASLAGWAVGAPREGAWLGVALTLVSTPHVPIGRERLRDWSSAAIAACCAAGGHDEPWAWGAALALAIGVAVAAGGAVSAVRQVAARVTDRLRAQAAQGVYEPGRLERWHLACGGLELLRGAGVAAVASWAIDAVLTAATPVLAGPERTALAAFWKVAPLAGLPLALRLRTADAPRGWLWPGVLLGAAVAWASWGGQP
jgi:mannose/fructose/N-acetylgalactosamine-specific phosphotransferase system component IIC